MAARWRARREKNRAAAAGGEAQSGDPIFPAGECTERGSRVKGFRYAIPRGQRPPAREPWHAPMNAHRTRALDPAPSCAPVLLPAIEKMGWENGRRQRRGQAAIRAAAGQQRRCSEAAV